MTTLLYSIVLITIGTLTILLARKQNKLAYFRESIKPGDLVFFLDRTTRKYLAATVIKKYPCSREHIMWGIDVHSEDGNYSVITSELNIFDKKYIL